MNRLKSHAHDNGSIRTDNRGILPLLPILIALLIGGGMALVAWAFFAELWISTMIFIVIFLFIWMMIKGMEYGIVGKRGMVLGIVLIFAFLMLAVVVSPIVFTLTIIPPSDYQTTTKQRIIGGWEGKGLYDDQGDMNELLHHSFYVAAWTGNDESEEIHIQGQICAAEGILWNFDPDTDDVKYRIWLATGTSWGDEPVLDKKVNLQGKSEKCALYPTEIYTIQGSFDGWIKAEILADFGSAIGGPTGWHVMAYDCAEIQSGKGDINFLEGIYEIDDMAKLKLDLGYAKGQYKLEVEAMTTGEMLYDGMLEESREGHITYMEFRVKSSHFALGSYPDCPENLIEARLWNELFPKAQHEVAITDIEALSPPKPSIELSNPSDNIAYRTGEDIKITITGEPNLETQAEVKEYRLRISPGDDVMENENGVFTFKPAHKGTYKLMYSCQDALCRRSEVVTKTITVYDKGDVVTDGAKYGLPWILIIVMLIWAIAGAWIYYDKKFPGTTKTKIIVILAGFAIISLAFLMEWIPYG